jgi:hypothetical protein
MRQLYNLGGGGDTSKFFIISKMLANLGRSGGCSPGKFFLFFLLRRLFLVASEIRLSVISTGSLPLVNYRMGNVFPPARSAKLEIIYGLKLPIWALSYILYM